MSSNGIDVFFWQASQEAEENVAKGNRVKLTKIIEKTPLPSQRFLKKKLR